MSGGTVLRDPRTPGRWWFRIDVTAPGQKRRQVNRKGFTSRKSAQDALDEFKRELHMGHGVIASRDTFGDFLTRRWLPSVMSDPKLKPTTKNTYRYATKHLVAGCGNVRLDLLTGQHIDALLHDLRVAGKSNSLQRKVHTTAHKSIAAAVRWRVVGFNVVDDAETPPQDRPNPRAWTPEQVGAFLRVAEADRWWPLWLLAATTGMRRGELVGCRWADLDFTERQLTIANNVTVVDHGLHHGTPKGNRVRKIRLDVDTVAALRSWRAVQNAERLAIGEYWPDHDFVFTWPDGSLLHPNVVSHAFARIVARSGLPTMTLHNMRHAWATNALAAGVHVRDVSERLGHSSTRITMDVYTAPSSERDAAAADLVAGLYGRRAR